MTDNTQAERLIEAALRVIALKGWRKLSIADVAAESGVPLVELYDTYPSKTELLAGLFRYVDRSALAQGPAAEGDSPRDRLFEVLMRRIDVLQSHREAFARLLRELAFEPQSLIASLPALARSMSWMMEAAGLSASGFVGDVRATAIGGLYLNTLRTWANDDSADLARTMATLDRGLREAEALARRCSLIGASGERPMPSPPGETPLAGDPSSGV